MTAPLPDVWTEEEPKRRLVNYAARDARLAVAPTAAKCRDWHDQIAVLTSKASRGLTPVEAGELAKLTNVLLGEVDEERVAFLQRVAGLTPSAAGNTRIEDARRALSHLIARVDELKRRQRSN